MVCLSLVSRVFVYIYMANMVVKIFCLCWPVPRSLHRKSRSKVSGVICRKFRIGQSEVKFFEESVESVKFNEMSNAIIDTMKSFVKNTSLCFLSTCFKRSCNSEIKVLFNLSCMLPKGPHNNNKFVIFNPWKFPWNWITFTLTLAV